MSSSARPYDLPRRSPLSVQCIAALRQGLAAGAWREYLPGERRLCDLFQVSRPTLRSALRQLAQEGVIETHQGRRNRIVLPPARPAPAGGLIVLVSQQPITETSLPTYKGISEMRTHLAQQGFATAALVCPPHSPRAQERRLEVFTRQNPVLCCVLLSVSRDIQAWFARREIPALVLGSCHPDVRLPSLDVDYRAVCRHAAGILRAKGHRRLALVVPDAGVAGDLASEEGFREGGLDPDGEAEPIILRHRGTPAHLEAKLDALLSSANPPTALVVAKPAHAFRTVMHLARRGIRVPDAVSLIARDWDPLFEGALSHYRFDDDAFAHRLSRLMAQMTTQGRLPAGPSLILPRFVAGGTVRPLPA